MDRRFLSVVSRWNIDCTSDYTQIATGLNYLKVSNTDLDLRRVGTSCFRFFSKSLPNLPSLYQIYQIYQIYEISTKSTNLYKTYQSVPNLYQISNKSLPNLPNLYHMPRSDNSGHITLYSQSPFHHTRHRGTSTDERALSGVAICNTKCKAYHFQRLCTSDGEKVIILNQVR